MSRARLIRTLVESNASLQQAAAAAYACDADEDLRIRIHQCGEETMRLVGIAAKQSEPAEVTQ